MTKHCNYNVTAYVEAKINETNDPNAMNLATISNDNKPKLKFNFSALEENMDYITDKISSNNVYMRPTYFLSGERSNYIQNNDMDYISKLFPIIYNT